MQVRIAGASPEAMRRFAYVRGQWHLMIYCCQWSLSLNGTQLASSESDEITVNRALGVLNGQALTDVSINPVDGSTRFTFDFGCVLVTTPAPDDVYDFEPVGQWALLPAVPRGSHGPQRRQVPTVPGRCIARRPTMATTELTSSTRRECLPRRER